MDTLPVLHLTQANKRYNGFPALIDASLDLWPGEVHALIGENGAGKSTLIKLLAGVLNADSMQVEMAGRAVGLNSPQAAYAHGLRFIHQELNIVPQVSAAENIFVGNHYPTQLGVFVNWRRLFREAAGVLGTLGITHIDPRVNAARLSPGDQMLIKIASAFVGSTLTAPTGVTASVYVMDEPTAALTGEESANLFAVIHRLRERGCGVLYVTHRLDEIFRIADRVTVMRDGRVAAVRRVSDTNASELIHLMTGRDMQRLYPPRTTPLRVETLLDVRCLTSEYLQDISFTVRAGEIVGVAGLSGAGRSELLRALLRAIRLRRGTILLEGAQINHCSPAGAWKRGIAFVPEERRAQGLVLSHSVSNNVTLPHLRMMSRAQVMLNQARERRLTQELGAQVRLKALGPRQITRELSGGNQQKVMFARALAGSPRVLLLDEPTRGVDVGARFDAYSLIRAISANGIGIVMVSSDLTELIGLCDTILAMHRGKLLRTVPADGLTEGQLLALCYGQDRGDMHTQSISAD